MLKRVFSIHHWWWRVFSAACCRIISPLHHIWGPIIWDREGKIFCAVVLNMFSKLDRVRISPHKFTECEAPVDILFPALFFPHQETSWPFSSLEITQLFGLIFPVTGAKGRDFFCFLSVYFFPWVTSRGHCLPHYPLLSDPASLVHTATAPPKWSRRWWPCALPSAKCLAVTANKTICYQGESMACHCCNLGRDRLSMLLHYQRANGAPEAYSNCVYNYMKDLDGFSMHTGWS